MKTDRSNLQELWKQQRETLVSILKKKGISNQKVLTAVLQVSRHEFVNPSDIENAYVDTALPLSDQQTISQPFVVARMTELLLTASDTKKVLEIGTGSGYQAAVLANVFSEVYSIERIKSLSQRADKLLKQLNYLNIYLQYGDGYLGWPENSPFDAIIVTAGAETIPQALLDQLADGGCLVMPVGPRSHQVLKIVRRFGNEYQITNADPVIFVPLVPGLD